MASAFTHTITRESQTKLEFGEPSLLHRWLCACGKAGPWFSDPDYVAASEQRHLEAVAQQEQAA